MQNDYPHSKSPVSTAPPPGEAASGPVLSLLVAAGENNVIGKDNKLPWHLPDDLKYFKNLTWAMPIVMGRKTFKSIGKPLPGRKNIVLTRNGGWKSNGIAVVHTLEEAVGIAEESGAKELFIIGGAEIFTAVFDKADKIYLTRIHHEFEGDVSFPEVSEKDWALVKERFCEADEKNRYAHTFQVWKRKKP